MRQQNEKKQEFDLLKAKHIFDLWVDDLDQFLLLLEEYEELEEKDRMAHGGIVNNGKKKGRTGKPKPTAAAAAKRTSGNN